MKPTAEQHNDFLARLPLTGFSFQHNDYVKVIAGPHAPDSGSVVSVEDIGPEPVYLVESESGTDKPIQQNHLELLAHE